jgi:DNA-binding IclR family transcriptional regulator
MASIRSSMVAPVEADLQTLTGLRVSSVDNLVQVMGECGYPTRKSQVLGALSNLIRRGVVRKADNGDYEIRL